MEIVDAHVHAMPRGTMNGGETDARLETVLAGLEARGVSRAVLMPINDPSWQPVAEMNDFSERAVAEHPELAAFVDLDISRAHFYRGIHLLEDEITRRVQNGLRGIKVHPQNLGASPDDWRLLPVYRLAGELGVPVAIHCYPAGGPGRIENSDPAAIDKVVRVFHRTTFIIAHLGGLMHLAAMPKLSQENVYFDTSGVLPELRRFYGVDQLRYILEEIGYDRILFASDFPAESLDEHLRLAQEIVPPEHLPAVLAENALQLGKRFGWWKEGGGS